jgi:A/G-specific adenine glycosylase
VEHAYSHFRITLHSFACRYVSGKPRTLGCAGWKWVRLDELDQYAFPAANLKIIAALRADAGGGRTSALGIPPQNSTP